MERERERERETIKISLQPCYSKLLFIEFTIAWL